MEGKTKVFIDFDDTLFDRERFIQEYFERISEITGAPFDSVDEAYHADGVYVKGYEGPEKHLEKLTETYSFDLDAVLSKVQKFLSDTSSYIFPEAQNFLSRLSNKYTLILITVGNPTFQGQKINGSGIVPFFESIKLVPADSYKAEFINKMVDQKEKFYLIDDKDEELDDFRGFFGDKLADENFVQVKDGDYSLVYSKLLSEEYQEESLVTA